MSRFALRLALGLSMAVALLAAGPARAQWGDEPPAQALTGVLKRIKDARTVRLGVRAAAVPFSVLAGDGRAWGYSVDLCLAIVDDIAVAVDEPALRVEYRRVTVADRLEQVAGGRVDLECGATTNTAERREHVAFSPLIFVAGTQLLVRRGSGVRSLRDLAGQPIVVVRGTTNESVMRTYAADARRRLAVVTVDDYPEAVDRVRTGTAAALAADDVLLAGLLAERGLRREFAIVGDQLSFEPYGIVFARDDRAFADVVQATFVRLATSRDLRATYNKWFLRPLPSGPALGLPMSLRLERSFELLGLPPE